MGRFRNRNKRKVVVTPGVKNKQQHQPTVDPVTGKKIPQTMVFSRSKDKLPPSLRQLEMDLRRVMLPFTAFKLKEKKRNRLKDFLNIAGPMGVTHFLMLSKNFFGPFLRVAKTPQGPTLTFKIKEYSLAVDVAQSQLRPRCPPDLFKNSPLLVMSGFGSQEEHLRLASTLFQNMFPTIDVNTVKLSLCQRIVLLNYNKDTKLIDFRHYSIRLQPVGVSRRIRKIVQNRQLPDLSSLQDVSDFVTRAGYGSESEADDEAATVSLTSDLGRVNRASTKSAVRLQEIGPRMTLELVQIEEGLCSGEVMFSMDGKNVNLAGQKEDDDEEDEAVDGDSEDGEDEEVDGDSKDREDEEDEEGDDMEEEVE